MLDAREVDRLKKLVALFDSPQGGERDNAVAAAGALLKRHGKSMLDLPSILGGAVAQPERRRSVEEDYIRAAAALRAKQEAEEAARRAREKAQFDADFQEHQRKLEAKWARQDAMKDAHASSINLRIQIQEEAVAAGFAPRDVLRYVRGKLVAQIRAWPEPAKKKPRKTGIRRSANGAGARMAQGRTLSSRPERASNAIRPR
jgi:hypothetical protein